MKLTLCKICAAQMSYWKSDQYYCDHNGVLAYRNKHRLDDEPEIVFDPCPSKEQAAKDIEVIQKARESKMIRILEKHPEGVAQ